MRIPKTLTTKSEIIAYKNSIRKKNYDSTRKPSNNKQFTAEEDALIMAHRITDRELSDRIVRSCQSIQARRFKIKSGQVKSNYKLYL